MAQPVPTQFFLLYSISNCNSVIPQLCYSAIVLFRNCVIPQLCYSSIVLFRNCVIPQLCYSAIVLFRNCVIPQLCYSAIVLFLNCVIPQLCYSAIVLFRNCVSAIVLFRTAIVLFRNCVIPQLCCGITLLQNYYIAELQYCRVIYIFHLKILLAFFPIFQSQNRQNEAKEPKAKRSWCSKNDLKMI
jgi:hypothetical protein